MPTKVYLVSFRIFSRDIEYESEIIINDIFQNETNIKKELIKEIKEIDDFTRLPIDLEKSLTFSPEELAKIYEEEYRKLYDSDKIKFIYEQTEKEI